ncbi:MAG: HDIG domain-containing protein [Thermoguttaceae bacterium]|nr:HDIG domain-containing protein [Thermoguttaceae bacterium]MBQ6615141.1 HDIG domain-containing protein [Thermoguttaceae bacterium]
MPEHQFIKDLADKTEVSSVYRIANKQIRLNRNGDSYLQVEIYDKTGTLTVRMWNAGENVYRVFEVGDYVQVLGKAQVFQGNLQIIAKKLVHAAEDAYNPDDYVKQAEIDITKLVRRLKQLVETIKTPSLRNLADCLLIDNEFMTRFCDAPAGVKNHHAYKGGLLEHTLSVMELADKTAALYPILNRDLLLTGALVHDISKIDEIRFDVEITYSDEGQLLGHLVMGVEKLNEKIAESERQSGEPMSDYLKTQLKHLIISHHGEYEFGSPKLPMTLEAITLHHLDCMDSKIVGFAQLIQEDMNDDSNWTCYVPSLQRKIFKGEK